MISRFDQSNYHIICNSLTSADTHLEKVITTFGYPPLWSRPNTFETLVHIILEQQVSLASALSALNKLKERIGEITPGLLLSLSEEELRACYFSRQKTGYIRNLAGVLLSGKLNLHEMDQLSDDAVRERLVSLKGIGNWTADVYLMFVLHRADIFPAGDLAAVKALVNVKGLPPATTREEVIAIAAQWHPYRTVATMLLWHYYLSSPKRKNK